MFKYTVFSYKESPFEIETISELDEDVAVTIDGALNIITDCDNETKTICIKPLEILELIRT